MSAALLDLVIVLLALAGAAAYLVRRWRRSRAPLCASGTACGRCEPAPSRGKAPALVQLSRRRSH